MSSFLKRYGGPLLLFLGGTAIIGIAPFVTPDRAEMAEPSVKPPPDMYNRAGHTMPGVRLPRAVPAAASGLVETDEVIGVVVKGKARAYAVKLMSGAPQDHVINDMIAGTPVTVSYNNVGRAIQVYSRSGSEPLDVSFGGMGGGQMVLEVDGRQFVQRTGTSVDPERPGQIPLDSVPHELTVWKKWRDAHPDTDVVVSAGPPATGDRPTSPRP